MGHRVFFSKAASCITKPGGRFPLCCQKIRQKRHLPTSCTFLLCSEIPQDFQKPGNNIGMQILPNFRGLTHQHCWKFISRSISSASRQQLSVSGEKKHLSVKGLCRVRCSGLVFGKNKSTTQKILLRSYQPMQSTKINVSWSTSYSKKDVKEYRMLLVTRQIFYAAAVRYGCYTGEIFSTFPPPEVSFCADPLLRILLLIQATPYGTFWEGI